MMNKWKKELSDLLKAAEKKAAEGGAYGLAAHLAKIAEPFQGSLDDDLTADIVAAAACVTRQPEDVCIVHVPPHWIEGLKNSVHLHHVEDA